MSHQSFHYVLCSTVYVINEKMEFLFFHHPKLKKWVPPGGKIEPHEMPQEAAMRECLEETGIQIQLIGAKAPLENGLIAPQGLEYNPAQGSFRAHLDFIYFGKSLLNHSVMQCEGEVRWFLLSEIPSLNTFPSIFKWCAKLIDQHFAC
jgi:8-oxo-dGTP diphosphatase